MCHIDPGSVRPRMQPEPKTAAQLVAEAKQRIENLTPD
jgi:hypothetical protein